MIGRDDKRRFALWRDGKRLHLRQVTRALH
jgi:hypothetical protein